MEGSFLSPGSDSEAEDEERDARAKRFWDNEFAIVLPPTTIADDLEGLTTPVKLGDPVMGRDQHEASVELHETLASMSFSSESEVSPVALETPIVRGEGGGDSGIFSPVRPGIGPLTVYSDSSSAASSSSASPPGTIPARPRLRPALIPRSPFSPPVHQPQQQEEGSGESNVVIQTPMGPRRLAIRPGARVAARVDSSNVTLAMLKESEVATFGLSSNGATRAMGGDAPTVVQTREGYTVVFESAIISQRAAEKSAAVTPGSAFVPFKVWTDLSEREIQPVPLGAFRVKSAYFVGTYKGDLVGKRECGMMYSNTEAAMTVIQSNHPDFGQQKSHFVVALKVNRNKQTLFQVAIHKRLWAHSWARGKEDVYFPRVPVFSGGDVGGSYLPTDIGIRIWASVYANKKGPRDLKTGRALEATVVVNKIAFELPLSVSQFITAPSRPGARGAIFDDDEED